jgi:hypothetical protein
MIRPRVRQLWPGYPMTLNDDAKELSDVQRDQILGLRQNFKWGSVAIAQALKLPEEKVARFLAPTPPKPDHFVPPVLDVGLLINQVRSILQTADYDQASLTQRYMDCWSAPERTQADMPSRPVREFAGSVLSRSFALDAARIHGSGERL